MTEEEAKKKECRVPVTVIVGISGSVARVDTIFLTCIASACMMWRWEARHSMDKTRIKGYCGLGGQYEDT